MLKLAPAASDARIFTLAEATAKWRISQRELRNAIKLGRLAHIRTLTGGIRLREQDVDQFLDSLVIPVGDADAIAAANRRFDKKLKAAMRAREARTVASAPT